VIYGMLETGHPWLYAVGILTAGITAYYMFRLLFVTFLGSYRGEVDPSDLGIRHPELAGTPAPHDAHEAAHHAPAWIMNLPVAILILPSVAIGWLMFGGDASPWNKFFSGQFAPGHSIVPTISELLTNGIVLAIVLAGFGIAYLRYATHGAQENAVERLRTESVRMPAVLTNAFYFDAALDLIFVRSAQLLGTLGSRVIDPHAIDGTVREVAFGARWLGVLVQSLQTGLVRAYAVILVFGAAAFIVYYALAGVPH